MEMKKMEHQIAHTHEGIRKLKETIGNNKMRAKALHAMTWFAEELGKLKETEFAVQCGVVYGPFARGTKQFQQLDLFLVLENSVDEEIAEEFIIDEVICKIYLEIQIFFNLDALNPEGLKVALEHPTPLIRRILKEGMTFYGHNVLNPEPKNVPRSH
jgi:hypothetical protein